MTPASAETIKRTPLHGQNVEVIIVRRSNPHLLQPYSVLLRDDLNGGATTVVGEFTCEAAALHMHDQLVKKKGAP